MEVTFVADYDYECPYCHGMLDYVEGNDNKKECKDCKKKFKVFTMEAE